MTEDDTRTKSQYRLDLIYAWPRFWVPQDGTIDLSDAGFLHNPMENQAQSRGPVQLAALQDWKALILLGEPGIGKSTTLKEEAERVAVFSSNSDIVSIYIDLRDFSSETLLYHRVFESEQFTAWKNGRSHLFLHLDSLDEALLRIDSIANLLASELLTTPTERMSIRIACRTAVWPADTLGTALRNIWGEASRVFELAPLRRQDLLVALETHGIVIEDFMRALFAAQAVPFAIKPLTLKMLLRIYQQGGNLPNSSIDLYERGCLALCEEQNKSRRDSGRHGRLNPRQRMRLAGRIAAATIFGNGFAVWRGPEIDCASEDIPISTLSGHHEEGELLTFNVTDDDLREVLDTGLFSSRGEGRMGWAHQGYGEFLAAFYLFKRNVPSETMLKVLLHPAGGLIPQLSVVAAWAASLSRGVRAALITKDPVVLLRGDLSRWSTDERASLVRSLLDSIENKQFTASPFSNAEGYTKLNHPGLADQLRPIITDQQLGAMTRRVGIFIAEKCRLTELQSELLQVALDAGDHPDVRALAVSALKYCGDVSVPDLVRPLTTGDEGPDPRDNIKGSTLDLLWPNHMSAAELFSLLTPPSVENHFGAYALFRRTLPDTLKTSDLLPALSWASQLITQTGPCDSSQDRTLADAIMFKAWQVFDDSELTRPFLDHIALRLRQYGDLCHGSDCKDRDTFMNGLRADVDRRRQFLLAVCAGALDRTEAQSYKHVQLLIEADLEWLLDISPGGSRPVAGLNLETLCNFIECVFVCENLAHSEALHAAAELWPVLRSRYAFWFEGVCLDSPEVAQIRAQQEQLHAIMNDRPPPIVPDLSNKILTQLTEAEAGRWQAWWKLICYLKLTPESRGWGDELDYFITAMPGWGDANEPLRHRIVVSAERYLIEAETSIDDWLGHNPMPIFRSDVAGLRAFILLKQESPEDYDRITKEIWQKWAPVIVGLPRHAVIDHSPDIAHILADALRHAPAEFVGAVRTIIRHERDRIRALDVTPSPGSPFFILHDLDGCWNNGLLKDAIYDELRNPDNTPEEFTALLDTLLKAGVEQALDCAVDLLAELGPSTRDRSLAIADVLLRRAAARAWPVLWATIVSDDDFARNVLSHVAEHFSFGTPFYADLSEREIGNLYVLMMRLFPRDDDTECTTGFMGTLESIGYLRDGAPRYLAGLGTEDAVKVLSELIADHTEFGGLAHELSLAERTMRIMTWSPMTPKEVLALTDKPDLQLVTSPSDLCQVLVAALEKYGTALHGAQTPVRDLWDRQDGKDTFRPIDENALSDVITRFLQTELGTAGIFANREVEVSRAPGAPIGRRTDILINAVRRRDDGKQFDPITAVIETKGCWNDELFTAIEGQLFREYMVRLRAQVGLYLVGWFDTAKWDSKDSRLKRVPTMTIEEAKVRLDRQAAELPEGFIVRPVIIDCRVP
ncbi:NACHT domain-containing protein [Beijerinckia mobilis]|uniref:NACHT domain-containing protein n=1 Tax=Beijerinckia mobilis TaxID=231434 RepID=UPI000ADB2713|nr:hypothetical protein [Beijerinckia mobilis]